MKHGRDQATSPEEREAVELNEIPGLFRVFDQHSTVDLKGVEDTYVQCKLLKLFRLMKLKHSKTNPLEFQKRTSPIHDFSLESLVRFIIKRQ